MLQLSRVLQQYAFSAALLMSRMNSASGTIQVPKNEVSAVTSQVQHDDVEAGVKML